MHSAVRLRFGAKLGRLWQKVAIPKPDCRGPDAAWLVPRAHIFTSTLTRDRDQDPSISSNAPDTAYGSVFGALPVVAPLALVTASHPGRRAYNSRAPWLRAAVLGASDGLVSTASLLAGASGANMSHETLIVTGLAGVVAGAASMAVGEYVSVSSQRDAEKADVQAIDAQLKGSPQEQHQALAELAGLYEERGLPKDLAWEVARQLTIEIDDPTKAHAKDKVNIDAEDFTNPWQAALASLLSFSAGGAMPLAAAALCAADPGTRDLAVAGVTILTLAGTGAWSAKLGGAPVKKATTRVIIGGTLAIAATHVVGSLFGVQVS